MNDDGRQQVGPGSVADSPDLAGAALAARAVTKVFRARGRAGRAAGGIRAVAGVTVGLMKGEVLGLVGESGSGKSTLGRLLAALSLPTSGDVVYKGEVFNPPRQEEAGWREARREVQVVFQDPGASLNPKLRVADSLAEGFKARGQGGFRRNREVILEMAGRVGVQRDSLMRYPAEFSGGQLQRIAIGRALLVQPEVLIADEPVSSLDLLVQGQVLDLLIRLREQAQFSMLFVSHNMAVVSAICDRVAVMYLGELVEVAPTRSIYEEPLHPYTVALLSAVPALYRGNALRGFHNRILLRGEVAPPAASGAGCPFRSRCPVAKPLCAELKPGLNEHSAGHSVACHFPGEMIEAAATVQGGAASDFT